MSVVFKTNPPECNEINFEKLLSTDELFLDCFNRFLSLEIFPKALKFNANNFAFEIVSSQRERLIKKIRSQVFSKTIPTEEINVNYNVKVLIGSQAVSWIKTNRLAYFLRSEYYIKYRLGKLLSQIDKNTDLSRVSFDFITPLLQEVNILRESPPLADSERNSSLTKKMRYNSLMSEDSEEVQNISFIAFNPLTDEKLLGQLSTETVLKAFKFENIQKPKEDEPENEPQTEKSVENDEKVQETDQFEQEPEQSIPGSLILQVKSTKKIIYEDPFADVDDIFYKNNKKEKEKDLNTISSYEIFKMFENFLKFYNAEKFMAFWFEIDKLKLIQEQIQFPRSIRDLFTRPTSCKALNAQHYEEIENPTGWNMETIFKLQNKIIEPLLTYWMPAFLQNEYLIDGVPSFLPNNLNISENDRRVDNNYIGALHKNIVEIENELIKPFQVYYSGVSQELQILERRDKKCRDKMEDTFHKLKRCLEIEKASGYPLYEYILNTGEDRLKNCYKVWNLIQDYNSLYEMEPLDVNLTYKYANHIYSTYLHSEAQNYIKMEQKTVQNIFSKLKQPSNELYKVLEVFLVKELISVYKIFYENDLDSLKKVPIKTNSVKLETKSKAVNQFVARGCAKKQPLFPFEPMQDYVDPIFDQELKVTSQRQDKISIGQFFSQGLEIENFKDFLRENGALMDFECWQDVEIYKRTPHSEKSTCEIKLMEIKGRYLNNKYFFGENSPANEREQNKAMALCGGWAKLLSDIPPPKIVNIMQTHAANRLNNIWIPAYLLSKTGESTSLAIVEKAEEKMKGEEIAGLTSMQSEEKAKSIELIPKREPSAVEILDFRSSMKKPETYNNFRAFLRTKGPNCDTNLLFWEEIQKYKQLFLSKCDDSLKKHKINSIINCFLNSQIPPPIQIAANRSIIDKIMESSNELNPYLFREAHFSSFRWLLTNWAEFVEFRKNTSSHKPSSESQKVVESVKEKANKTKATGFQGNRLEWSYSAYLKSMEVEIIVNENRDKDTKKRHN